MPKNINHFLDNYHRDTNNLTKHIASQLPKEIGNYDRFSENTLDFYTLLDSLHSHNAYYTYVDSEKIENLSLQDLQDESKLGYFYCLYYCNPLIVLDNENKTTLNEKIAIDNFGYKDDFYLSFIANKDSLSDDYLNARKSLYKTYQQIKQEQAQVLEQERLELEQQLQGLDSKARESKLQEIQREREKALREQQRQERMQRARNPNTTNHLILETKDKNNVVIFLDSDISLSNLIHIHNNKIDIFTKDGTILDIQRLETLLQEYININHNTDNNTNNNDNNTAITLDLLNSPNTQIFLYSQLLLGGSESPISSQEYFFGLLDSKNSDTLLDTLKPIYYFAPKDESSGLGKLSIFYHSSTLTLLNYSIIDSSLRSVA